MTREEALVFLELPVTATPAEIKTRIAEKMAFYELHSEKAPSDFLRRLNLRNLGKVKNILKDSAPWTTIVAEPAQPVAIQEDTSEEEQPLTVYIVPSMKEAVLKEAESREIKIKKIIEGPAGWLITHTENKPAQQYPVVAGKNFIGRKAQAGMEPFIVVEGDDFISRVQCVVYAEEGDPFVFYISDPAEFNKGKTSKNGTFINGQPIPVTQKIHLFDGDTIQTGVTKLVIRLNTGIDSDTVLKEVEQSKYVDTVLLEA